MSSTEDIVKKILEDKGTKLEDKDTKIGELPCPGSKIRSEGRGRGLGIGKGKGPIGRYSELKD